MKILIVSQYFFPENFRINDFAVEFQKRGHYISVLTAVPNYPDGIFFRGYGIFKRSREIYNDIKIYRSPLLPRGSGSNIRLALNYITYVIGSIFTSLFIPNNKFDIIFVFEPSPITVGLPAIFIKKIKKIPICFWVLDLWPESVIAGSNTKSNFIPNLLMPVVKYIYNQCDTILVSSRGFISSIVDKGIDKKKIHFFPQWAEPIFKPLDRANGEPADMPKTSFKIMFAGNIGEGQDFPSIIKAADILRDEKHIHWIILGNGSRKKWAETKVKSLNLDENFHFLGSHPLDEMPKYYSNADVMLFSLKKEYIYSITIPAKVQTYLACGKPILAIVDGEASDIIKKAGAGLTCGAGNAEGLANNILSLSKYDRKKIKAMGLSGLDYYLKNYERKMLFQRLEIIFNSLTTKMK